MGTVPFLVLPENMLPTKHNNLNPGVPRPLDNKGTLPSTKVKALPPENTKFFNNALSIHIVRITNTAAIESANHITSDCSCLIFCCYCYCSSSSSSSCLFVVIPVVPVVSVLKKYT